MDPVLNELRAMVIFSRVVESGSFSATAKRQGVSRAVISYQIKQLETALGVRLLHRSTRRLSLTDAGKRLYQSCKRIAQEAESAHQSMQDLREEAVGNVTLACPINLGMRWIVPIANLFRERYPQISLDLQFSEGLTDIISQGIDLAVRAGPLPDSDLQAIKVASVSRHICASPEYLNRYGWPRSVAQLSDHEWIIYSRHSQTLKLTKGEQTVNVAVQGKMRTNNAAARLAFTKAGRGLAVLTHYDAAPALQRGELVELFADYQLPGLELFAVFPTGSTRAKATRLLLDMLREYPPESVFALEGQPSP